MHKLTLATLFQIPFGKVFMLKNNSKNPIIAIQLNYCTFIRVFYLIILYFELFLNYLQIASIEMGYYCFEDHVMCPIVKLNR